MSPLEAFGIIVGAATFAGVVLAIYYGRREGGKRKLLAYQATVSRFPIASSASLEAYNLSLVYEAHGGERREIGSAYAQYLRFANFGREPIRGEDIAPANHLRIEVEGSEVLDVSIEASRRDVCRVAIGPIEPDDDGASIPVHFDFLDYLDGSLLRLLTRSRPEKVTLVGDIIGMPDGVKTTQALRGRHTLWAPVGTALAVMFEIASLVLTVFVYRWVLGGWEHVWLVALPLVALLVPAVVSAIISTTVWPKPGPRFPSELLPRGLRLLPPHAADVFFDQDMSEQVIFRGDVSPRLPSGEAGSDTEATSKDS